MEYILFHALPFDERSFTATLDVGVAIGWQNCYTWVVCWLWVRTIGCYLPFFI